MPLPRDHKEIASAFLGPFIGILILGSILIGGYYVYTILTTQEPETIRNAEDLRELFVSGEGERAHPYTIYDTIYNIDHSTAPDSIYFESTLTSTINENFWFPAEPNLSGYSPGDHIKCTVEYKPYTWLTVTSIEHIDTLPEKGTHPEEFDFGFWFLILLGIAVVIGALGAAVAAPYAINFPIEATITMEFTEETDLFWTGGQVTAGGKTFEARFSPLWSGQTPPGVGERVLIVAKMEGRMCVKKVEDGEDHEEKGD